MKIRPVAVIEAEVIEKSDLEILQDAELAIIEKIAKFPDQIVELAQQLIRAQQRTALLLQVNRKFWSESGDWWNEPLREGLLPPESFAGFDEKTLKLCGIYKLGDGVFTNSLPVFAERIDALLERISVTKGMAKMGLIEKYKQWCSIYNKAMDCEVWNAAHFG